MWFTKLPSWRAAKECRVYLPRPPPSPDPVLQRHMFLGLCWRFECIFAPSLILGLFWYDPAPATYLSLALSHVYGALALSWAWRRFHDLRQWIRYPSLVASASESPLWVIPVVVRISWVYLDPLILSPHSQLLTFTTVGLIMLQWFRLWCSELCYAMDVLGRDGDRPSFHVTFVKGRLALLHSPSTIAPVSFISLVMTIHSISLGTLLLLRWSHIQSGRILAGGLWLFSMHHPLDSIRIAPVPPPFHGIRYLVLTIMPLIPRLIHLVLHLGNLLSHAAFAWRFASDDPSQLLDEALDLLDLPSDFELSWQSFSPFAKIFREPYADLMDTCMPPDHGLAAYFSLPVVSSVHHCLPERELLRAHGWRLCRRYRNIDTLITNKLVAAEKQAMISSPVPLDLQSPSPVESGSFMSSRILDSFISMFNPATRGLELLSERLERHRLRTITAPYKVSVNLRYCLDHMLLHTREWFFLPAMTELVFNTIGGPSKIPLIMDTGASCCISPCRADFIDYKQSTVNITDLSSTNKVAGEGLIKWDVLDVTGKSHTILIKGFHVPRASVRLLSPQCLLQLDPTKSGRIEQDLERFRVFLGDGTVLDASYGKANLPILPMFVAGQSNIWTYSFSFSKDDRSAYVQNLLHEKNANLTLAQKELLLWHFKLSHANLPAIRNLCRQKRTPRVTDETDLLPLLQTTTLPCTYKIPSDTCEHLLCSACATAKAHRKRPGIHPSKSSPTYALLSPDNIAPGDYISCDHYGSPIKGRVVSASGHSSTRYGYEGGCIFVDHASGWIMHRPQQSMSASDTIRSKLVLEREAADVNVKIKTIHTDNGVFNSKEFRAHCQLLHQKLKFSGVGAHHQNGIAENAIRTICNMARANMLHAMLRWPEKSLLDLWPFAMSYAIWVHNRLPPGGYGLCPLERWSRQKIGSSELNRAHVFGCPVYVLDPALQDGKKTPKWDSKARQGIFVGFSDEHSSLAPLVLNPRTQHISPQYHLIFDDNFTTVPSLYTLDERNTQWQQLFRREHYELFIDPNDTLQQRTLLQDQWLSSDEISHRDSHGTIPLISLDDPGLSVPSPPPPPIHQNEQRPTPPPASPVPSIARTPRVFPDGSAPLPTTRLTRPPAPASEGVLLDPPSDSATSIPSVDAVAPEGAVDETTAISDSGAPDNAANDTDSPATSRYPRRSTTGDWKNGPARDRILQEHHGKWKTGLTCLLALPMYALSAARDWGQPPAGVTNIGAREGPVYSSLKISKDHLSHLAVLQDDWSKLGSDTSLGLASSFSAYLTPDLTDDISDLTISDIQPHILQAKMRVSDPDNPTFRQAMASPDSDKWWGAMEAEMDTLEGDLKAWKLVKREPWMNVLPSTWAFKIKRYPDGTVKKYKARFCVRGDRQLEGIDFWETWSPVVQWSTVRTLMTLSTKLGLHSVQADITAAFVHAPLKPGEQIFVHQPQGLNRGKDLVLSLSRSVYGLRQAPRYFFEHLSHKLSLCGLKQSDNDPCLFIGKEVLAVIYVDDVLFYSKSTIAIDNIIDSLRDKHDIAIRKEGDADGFLGVNVARCADNKLVLTQTGLTERIVKALGLCSSHSTSIGTPAETAPLPKDAAGPAAIGNFNYAAIVGMLLYLSGHSRPDIAFAVHQCARYTFKPSRRHEQALIRIGRYLKGTMHRGMILTPTDSPTIECYPDADFAGLYGHEDSQDPHCVRSRTGYIITAFGCPILWKSRLQTEIALSTMEAEYVALSTACKDLFPIVTMIKEVAQSVGISVKTIANMHIKIHEDNVGALTLAKLEPARMTPRSKHYAIKYHWFREHVHANRVKIVKIDSANQLGDMFTKGLARPAFERLRLLLMGW